MIDLKCWTLSSKPLSLWQSGLGILGGVAIATSTLTNSSPATAQAAYGSYIGIGPAFGLTSGSQGGEPSRTTGVVAVRYKLLTVPFSIRTQALIGDGSAIVPTVSYDVPLNWRTDAYIGAGVSIPLNGDKSTPVGNDTSFALQPGIDYALPNSKLVVFGNAIIAFDAYRRGGNTAISVQGGVGLRF